MSSADAEDRNDDDDDDDRLTNSLRVNLHANTVKM